MMRFHWKREQRDQQTAIARAVRDRLAERSIVMVGLMGCGKSSVGRRLAAKLQLPFVDADDEIELAAGKSISDIFAENGEADFRDGERKVITRLLLGGPQVLATGGGAFMTPETRAGIADKGVSVWLKADLALLMQRVRRRAHRPLLQAPDPDAVMQDLITERYPVYAKANLIIESRDVSHDVVVDEIVRGLADGPLATDARMPPDPRADG